MNSYILFFILVYSILIACSTLFILVWYFSSLKKKELLKEIIAEFFPKVGHSLFTEGESGAEVEAQIDSRLNDIITGFKKQIPMISMFLSKSKEAELKETARVELVKLIPSIKQHITRKLDGVFVEGELSLKIGQVLDRLWGQVRCRSLMAAILIGAFMGIVEAVLLMYFL